MTRRHPVHRVCTISTYTAIEIAEALKVRTDTVYRWFGQGLTPIDRQRPYLVHGAALAAFLIAKNKPRCPLGPGEIYCVACKRACEPAGAEVRWTKLSSTAGDLVGTCPACSRRVYRRVRIDRLSYDIGNLQLVHEDDTTTDSPVRVPPHMSGFRGTGQ